MAIVKVTPERIARAIAETDWAAIDAQTDEDIARNVANDPDAAPLLTEAETAAALVRTVRKRLLLSQAAFAARFHIPVGTLRDWEQNRRQPDAPAFAYLRVIVRDPEQVARALAPAHPVYGTGMSVMAKGFSDAAQAALAPQIAANPEAAPDMAPAIDVRAIRRATGMTQAAFAAAYEFSLRAIQDWERGAKRPTGPARTLLRAIKADPEGLRRALAAA